MKFSPQITLQKIIANPRDGQDFPDLPAGLIKIVDGVLSALKLAQKLLW